MEASNERRLREVADVGRRCCALRGLLVVGAGMNAPVGVPSGWDEVGALFCKCGDFTVLLVHARRVRSSAEWYCDTAYHDWTLSPEDVA